MAAPPKREPHLVDLYRPRVEAFRSLYRALRPEFERNAAGLA
ncbi:hypothetical protein [Microvirga arsenatis]|nr:hypothetical protein [Microvirga arsenatis]